MSKLWPAKAEKLDEEQQKALQQQLLPDFLQLLEAERIPASDGLVTRFADLYLPLANWLASKHPDHPFIVGINGAQGSGKSTLTKILALILEKGFCQRVASLSIDDLYKTREARKQLAKSIHPMLMTRGVPGTHDIAVGLRVLATLKGQQNKHTLKIPRFNKATDDRFEEKHWQIITPPVDFVLFEGWCVGARAEDENTLTTPVNTLEAEKDPESIWRKYVNRQLAGPYQELFSFIDILIMLEAPAMQHVCQWRKLQEEKLATSVTMATPAEKQQIMTETELEDFIMHFERLTRAMLQEIPGRADIVLKLDENQQVSSVALRN